jgi:(4S)-4-hydroxy-5-phosphonooxypentane-2,3-dione isomerase
MYIVCVTIFVKEGDVEQFIQATLENCRETRKEKANLRFDFLRSEEDPNRFFLYEAYTTKEDFAVHQQTPHYLKWKETVAGMMAQPRQGVRHYNIFPEDLQWQ